MPHHVRINMEGCRRRSPKIAFGLRFRASSRGSSTRSLNNEAKDFEALAKIERHCCDSDLRTLTEI